jgi:hypothetical protein
MRAPTHGPSSSPAAAQHQPSTSPAPAQHESDRAPAEEGHGQASRAGRPAAKHSAPVEAKAHISFIKCKLASSPAVHAAGIPWTACKRAKRKKERRWPRSNATSACRATQAEASRGLGAMRRAKSMPATCAATYSQTGSAEGSSHDSRCSGTDRYRSVLPLIRPSAARAPRCKRRRCEYCRVIARRAGLLVRSRIRPLSLWRLSSTTRPRREPQRVYPNHRTMMAGRAARVSGLIGARRRGRGHPGPCRRWLPRSADLPP